MSFEICLMLILVCAVIFSARPSWYDSDIALVHRVHDALVVWSILDISEKEMLDDANMLFANYEISINGVVIGSKGSGLKIYDSADGGFGKLVLGAG